MNKPLHSQKEIKALRDAIIVAENSIKTAKQLLQMITGETSEPTWFSWSTEGLQHYNEGDAQIIEGIFTGEAMLGSDGNIYPIPQNYASKSLLVQWSKLKATIFPNGKITYKIIEEIPYETLIGIVTKAWEKYQITTEHKTLNVLMAAITFHKCSIGDTVSIRVPAGKEPTYAVIENIVPKN